MELRVLRYFLAVTRENNITAAARALHITQPTLSKQLLDLEKELGKKLFKRGSRQITLTEEGRFLRKRAQEIIDLVDKTQLEFTSTEEMLCGDIYIGGGETEAMRLIAKTAQKLHQIYPDIRYHLFSGSENEVTEWLDKGLLDFGILVGVVNLAKYDFLQLPIKEIWGLLLPRSSELAQLKNIRPDNLADIPLLGSRQALVQNELSGWLGNDFAQLNIVATYNLLYNVSLMVEEGLGYAICLDGLINTSGHSKLCFRPFEPQLKANLYLVWKKQPIFSKATEKFLEKLTEEI